MSLQTRMGNRKPQKFSSDIMLDTAKQRVWALAFEQFIINTYNVPCEKIEYGVDNTGEIIEGNLQNDNVDNVFSFNYNGARSLKVEIKTIPEYCNNFMTFKVESLKSCIRQKAFILVPKRNLFYFFAPRACNILYEKPHKRFGNFAEGKLAVRIYKNGSKEDPIGLQELIKKGNKYLVVKNWPSPSKETIENNWELLSKERN